ncbi:MAG TPA: hypothetical protein IAB69_03895 [Candidatus Coproplasma excrementigallinarum]|uniref:Uncharacterized protein n=1 Tax=Candidatus Coproplasma excrementigallinarum TaxID=2840747 RepID=A0A9D1MK59_9FIRM|nr:hypothetical protein [Candidatus Coproplasma excrementigallinarum]
MNDEGIKKALLKCAVGFDTSEVVEEYAVDGEELRLVKRKVTRRDVPPDIKAVKMLLDGDTGVENLSDEELEERRKKLIELLKEDNIGKEN